jgi:hypothetical protein
VNIRRRQYRVRPHTGPRPLSVAHRRSPRSGGRRSLPSPALLIALLALVLSTTGAADAARHVVVGFIAGHPVTSKPRAGAVLVLGPNRKFPASAIPTVANAKRLGGQTPEQLTGTCPPQATDLGSWCIDSAPFPVTNADKGKNNFIWANKACEAEGGWLPSAAELVGAANRVKLESTIKDSELTATVNLDPTRGLKDEREMSSSLVTTEGGPAAAGSEGVSEGATGNPRQGQPNPIPVRPNPLPESLQYVTVYDNSNEGGFAGSQPVKEPQNFRCAFNKTPGAQANANS